MKWELDLWYEMWDKAGSQGLDTWYEVGGRPRDDNDPGSGRVPNVDGLDGATGVPSEAAGSGREGE